MSRDCETTSPCSTSRARFSVDKVPDARTHLLGDEGFHHIVLCALPEELHPESIVGAGGDDEHGDRVELAVLAEGADELVARHPRHHEIRHDRVRGPREGRREPRLPVRRGDDLEVGREHLAEEAAHIGVVLHHQDARPVGPVPCEDRRGVRLELLDDPQAVGEVLARGKPGGGPGERPRRDVDGEERAALGGVRHLDRAAVELHELLRDREAEPRPADAARGLVVAAGEPGEHHLALRGGNPGAAVGDLHHESPRRAPRPPRFPAEACSGRFHGPART